MSRLSLDRFSIRNVFLYTTLTQAASPVTLTEMKDYMKITTTADDTLIQGLIDACTSWGEDYTCRAFRLTSMQCEIDFFESRMNFTKSFFDDVTIIEYTNDQDQLITVPNTVWQSKTLQQSFQILLQPGQEWPTDVKELEQQIRIEFTLDMQTRYIEEIKTAIMRHVLFMYRNRGDCGTCEECADSAGVKVLYDYFRVARV